jgi:CheY-like chemotaxis protein
MLFLVVDDSPLARQHVTSLLPEFEVEGAGSGREALAAFAARAHDLVILDIFMPEMDGFELLTALRRLKDGVPVIGMSARIPGTAWGRADFLRMLRTLGASAVLRKPFTREELLDAIRSTAGRDARSDMPRLGRVASA